MPTSKRRTLRYAPNDMELKAIRALALSGSACIRCLDDKVGVYQQNRLRTMLRNAGCGRMVVVGRKGNVVYTWMLSVLNYPHIDKVIIESIGPNNTFTRLPGRGTMRDTTADAESILARFTPIDKPKVTMSKVSRQAVAIAKKQLKAGKIDEETYKEVLKQYDQEV